MEDSPRANPQPPEAAARSSTIPHGTLETLAGTTPWMTVVSIFSVILIGVSLLSALVSVSSAVTQAKGDNSTTLLPIFAGCIRGLWSLAFIFAVVKLRQYSAGILQTLQSGSTADLQLALEHQRGFWKYTAIILLLSGAMFLLLLVFAFFSPSVSAA